MSGAECRTLLSRYRLRSTEGRVRILHLMASSPIPLSAAQVHRKLGEGRPDLATIYRTLERFAEVSLVRALRFGDGARCYEIARGEHHHHLVCTICGSVADLATCRVEPLEDLALHRYGFHVASHSLEFYGTCRECTRRPQ